MQKTLEESHARMRPGMKAVGHLQEIIRNRLGDFTLGCGPSAGKFNVLVVLPSNNVSPLTNKAKTVLNILRDGLLPEHMAMVRSVSVSNYRLPESDTIWLDQT